MTTQIQYLKEGQTIIAPYAPEGMARGPVKFISACMECNDDDDMVWAVSFEQPDGNTWCVYMDAGVSELNVVNA